MPPAAIALGISRRAWARRESASLSSVNVRVHEVVGLDLDLLRALRRHDLVDVDVPVGREKRISATIL